MEDIHTREWCLFHIDKKSLIKSLSLLQIRAILKIINEEDRERYWIWKDGYRAWMPLANCEIAMRPLSEGQQPLFPPPPPGMEKDYAPDEEYRERLITLEGEHDEPLALETVVTTIGESNLRSLYQGAVEEDQSAELTINAQEQVYLPNDEFEYHEGTDISVPIEIDDQDFIEKRQAVRYRRRYKIIIEIDGQQHLTHTVSVSTKSLQIEGRLPLGFLGIVLSWPWKDMKIKYI